MRPDTAACTPGTVDGALPLAQACCSGPIGSFVACKPMGQILVNQSVLKLHGQYRLTCLNDTLQKHVDHL